MDIKIPVYSPCISGNESKYVNDCINSGWISSRGGYVNKFENTFSEFLGSKYSSAVSNGTIALHLALLALGIGEGDEVIVPTFTYIASVNAIKYVGATPVFVDSLFETWQMNPAEIKLKITKKTKAIIAVHLYGHPCDMDKIIHIKKSYGLKLVEDCAEAIGSKYRGKYVGTFGDVSTFSFFGNKTITTGEGGMVCTDDKNIYDLVNKLKSQGLAINREYFHDLIGYNYRMTNICAAIGLAQMEKIAWILNRKKEIADFYKKNFKNKVFYHMDGPDIEHTYWMFSILLDDENTKLLVRSELKKYGIETRPTFVPAHIMPMYSDYAFDTYNNAIELSLRGVNLPSWPGLSDSQLEFIVRVVNNTLENLCTSQAHEGLIG